MQDYVDAAISQGRMPWAATHLSCDCASRREWLQLRLMNNG